MKNKIKLSKRSYYWRQQLAKQVDKLVSGKDRYLKANFQNVIGTMITNVDSGGGYKKPFLKYDINYGNRLYRPLRTLKSREVQRVQKITKQLRKLEKSPKSNYQTLKLSGLSKQEILDKLGELTGEKWTVPKINKQSTKRIINFLGSFDKDLDSFYESNRELIINYNRSSGKEKVIYGKELEQNWIQYKWDKTIQEQNEDEDFEW